MFSLPYFIPRAVGSDFSASPTSAQSFSAVSFLRLTVSPRSIFCVIKMPAQKTPHCADNNGKHQKKESDYHFYGQAEMRMGPPTDSSPSDRNGISVNRSDFHTFTFSSLHDFHRGNLIAGVTHQSIALRHADTHDTSSRRLDAVSADPYG